MNDTRLVPRSFFAVSARARETRYLYDQIESSLQEKIDDFYRRMNDLNSKLSWGERIATQIINEELCKVFDEQRDFIKNNMEENSRAR